MPTPGDRLTRTLRATRRAVLRRRRLLAAVLAGVAVLAAVSALRPPAASVRHVTVAAHDLAAGRTLTADDLTTADWTPGSAPAGLGEDAVGRVLASPLRRGEPVTDVRLVGPALAVGQPGLEAVPVRLPDAGMVDLLRVGDRVDLVAADPQGSTATSLVDDVPVLAVPAPSADDAGSALPGRLVVVGLRPADVPAVAQASVGRFVTYTWSNQ